MFERYTEKARRVIFFARYEASKYGSQYIGAEHLLLGLIREVPGLCTRFLGPSNFAVEIRNEIEKGITPRKRVSSAVEVPLAKESKRVLMLAAEESEKLKDRHIGPEHFLLGILGVDGSLAARLLFERGLKLALIREELAKAPIPMDQSEATTSASLTLESFLTGLASHKPEELISFFKLNAEFIDVTGKLWNREEIWERFETLFAPYAKKNASYVVEATLADTGELFVANILWRNGLLASEQRAWMHRMSVVLLPERDNWLILLIQVTPVHPS